MSQLNFALVGSINAGKEFVLQQLCGYASCPAVCNDIAYHQIRSNNTPIDIWNVHLEHLLLQWPMISQDIHRLFLCHDVTNKNTFDALIHHAPQLSPLIPQSTLLSLQCGNKDIKDLSLSQLNKAHVWSQQQNIPHMAISGTENFVYKLKIQSNKLKLKVTSAKIAPTLLTESRANHAHLNPR